MNQMDISKAASKSGLISWPEASPEKQSFSLPSSIIYYMAKNPSTPKAYLKMVQSCKYFFEKNPILIVARINGDVNRWCEKNFETCYGKNDKCCINLDINRITCKIWLTDEIRCTNDVIPKAVLLLPSKIYRCEEALLDISFSENAEEQFKLFASKFQRYELQYVSVFDGDGNIMMLEKMIELISNVKDFHYNFTEEISSYNVSTIKNISKLKNLNSLRKFELEDIPAIFPVKDFADLIKTHKNTKFYFGFTSALSKPYKKQLDSLIDTIIDAKLDCVIHYSGQNKRKCDNMQSRYYKEVFF